MIPMLYAGTASFVLSVIVAVIQMLASPWSPEVFIKIELTIFAALTITTAIWFADKERREYEIHKQRLESPHTQGSTAETQPTQSERVCSVHGQQGWPRTL